MRAIELQPYLHDVKSQLLIGLAGPRVHGTHHGLKGACATCDRGAGGCLNLVLAKHGLVDVSVRRKPFERRRSHGR